MVRFVVFSDLHYDHIFDGDRRIDELTNYMQMVSVDFAISLGDLCAPVKENERILNKFNSIGIPVYHVIGNHDSDSYTQEKVMSFLSLEELNYSFTYEDIKFIVLNSCYMLKDGIEYPYYKRNYEKKADFYGTG